MAASSSSTLVPSSSSFLSFGSFKYQVFLSFRGVDTRKGFTWNLYNSLKDAGISKTFMDEKDIEAGEEIDERLLKAIEDSRYCVVILSSRYADSKACLMELAAMFRLKKEIIPVFFYVEPSNVSHQSGPFKMAFSTHQKCSNSSRDVEEWRQAMSKVGQLKGFLLNHQSNKKEAQVIQEIVERVGGRSDNVMLYVADHPVGMDSSVEEVMKLLSIEEGGVKMVGIYGMGGVGKTTLAKEIHNRLQARLDKAIYIEGIRDGVKKDGLPKLQQQFISKAFKHGTLDIYNSSEGMAQIRMRFRQTRLLAILDDVDHRDQLKALAGGCDWFGEGTRILITTRDLHVLDAHRVERKHEVRELNYRDSLRLFSWHAFNDEKPSEEYVEISEQVAEAAGGLPLALEVLGSSLIGKNNKRIWQEVVTKLRGLAYNDIDGCLRISYDGLDQEEKSIFLDVACFFIDKKKEHVIDILKGCGFKAPELTIDALSQKCLLDVDDLGKLRMHDLLRDMGRNISSHSRLWDQQQVWDVLDGHAGTPEIEGIVCRKIPEREEENLDVEAFTNMSNLRLLHLYDIHLMGDFSKMAISLRSLEWKYCSMKMLPDNFNIQKIGFLDLSRSNIIQVWSDSYMSKKMVSLQSHV